MNLAKWHIKEGYEKNTIQLLSQLPIPNSAPYSKSWLPIQHQVQYSAPYSKCTWPSGT